MNFSYLKLWICYCSGRSRNVKKGWLGTCWEKVLWLFGNWNLILTSLLTKTVIQVFKLDSLWTTTYLWWLSILRGLHCSPLASLTQFNCACIYSAPCCVGPLLVIVVPVIHGCLYIFSSISYCGSSVPLVPVYIQLLVIVVLVFLGCLQLADNSFVAAL